MKNRTPSFLCYGAAPDQRKDSIPSDSAVSTNDIPLPDPPILNPVVVNDSSSYRRKHAYRLVDNRLLKRKALSTKRSRSKLDGRTHQIGTSSGNRFLRGSVNCKGPLPQMANITNPPTLTDPQFSLAVNNLPSNGHCRRVSLNRVIGISELSNRGFALNTKSGDVGYAAGASVILCNPVNNQQSFLLNSSKKAITCVAFSPDGRYAATGERGHDPQVRIWDLSDLKELAAFSGHRYSVDAVCFSPNIELVVSIGTIHDMVINVWNCKIKCRLSSNNISFQIAGVAFHEDGSSFVTVGNHNVKFWYLEPSLSNQIVPLRGKSGVLGEKKRNFFCDVACGRGDSAGRTYTITSSGLLCEFSENRLLERWLDIKAEKATCLAVGECHILVGCFNGLIRVLTSQLQFVTDLPLPLPLSKLPPRKLNSTDYDSSQPKASNRYPNVLAIIFDEERLTVYSAHNDHSWYGWDISNLMNVNRTHYNLAHSGCIWSLASLPKADSTCRTGKLHDTGIFISCSSDGSCRTWKMDEDSNTNCQLTSVVYLDGDNASACESVNEVKISGVSCDDSLQNSRGQCTAVSGQQSQVAARCVAIDLCGIHIAIGDSMGNVRVFQSVNMNQIYRLESHCSDVLALCYSHWSNDDSRGDENIQRLLASSGRDRFIHLFDRDKSYSLIYSIEDHSAAISSVILSLDKLLISTGADKNTIVRSIKHDENKELRVYRLHQIVERHSILCTLIEEKKKIIVSACQDRLIRLYAMNDGKRLRWFRGSLSEDGNLVTIALDPSGSFVASSSSDKSICILTMDKGEFLAALYGHSEVTTGLAFSPSARYLYSAGADSCIFVWKLGAALTQCVKRRDLVSSACKQSRADSILKTTNNSNLRNKFDTVSSVDVLQPSPPKQNTMKQSDQSIQNPESLIKSHQPRQRTLWSMNNPNKIIGGSYGSVSTSRSTSSQSSLETTNFDYLNNEKNFATTTTSLNAPNGNSVDVHSTFIIEQGNERLSETEEDLQICPTQPLREENIERSPEAKKRHICRSVNKDSLSVDSVIDQVKESVTALCNLLCSEKHQTVSNANEDYLNQAITNLLTTLWTRCPEHCDQFLFKSSQKTTNNQSDTHSPTTTQPEHLNQLVEISQYLRTLQCNPVLYETAVNMLKAIQHSLRQLSSTTQRPSGDGK